MTETLSKNKRRFYERMLSIADLVGENSNEPRYRFGAVLEFNKTVISSGYNYRKTHPFVFRNGYRREEGKQGRTFVHGEVSCLNRIRIVPKGATLFVSRRDRFGNRQFARPCPVCMEQIRIKGVETVIYTTESGFAVEHFSHDN